MSLARPKKLTLQRWSRLQLCWKAFTETHSACMNVLCRVTTMFTPLQHKYMLYDRRTPLCYYNYAGRYPSILDVTLLCQTYPIFQIHLKWKKCCVKMFQICMNCLLSLLSSALIFRSDCTLACYCLRFLRFRRGFSLFFLSQEFFLNWFYLGTRWNTWKLALRSMSLIQKSATDRVTFLWASRTITFPSYIGNWGRSAKTMKRTLTSITRVCYVETGDLPIRIDFLLHQILLHFFHQRLLCYLLHRKRSHWALHLHLYHLSGQPSHYW